MFARHLRAEVLRGETSGDHRETRERQLAAAAVAAQVALLAAQVVLRRRHDWPTPAAVKLGTGAVTVAGAAVIGAAGSSLGRGLTASPLPNPHAELRTDGLYRFVRHPIYTGVLAMSWARTAASGDRRQVALSVLLMLLLYSKSTLEEQVLARRFSAYPSYAAGTPRFIPCVSHR